MGDFRPFSEVTSKPATGKAVTSFDVAILAGVSQSTVSKALRNDPGISEKTRTRVAQAAQDLGYVLNSCASRLRRQAKTSIAVVIVVREPHHLDDTNHELMCLLPALCQQIELRGCEMLLSVQCAGTFRSIAPGNVLGMIVLGTCSLRTNWICDHVPEILSDVFVEAGPDDSGNWDATTAPTPDHGVRLVSELMTIANRVAVPPPTNDRSHPDNKRVPKAPTNCTSTRSYASSDSSMSAHA